MRQSKLFSKTYKRDKDYGSINEELLLRAGFIHKEMAGVYAYLPMGLKVVEKIKQIVREEMDAIGGQEIIMTALQKKETWLITDRWDDTKVDVWFKSKLKNDTEVGFGWSHEEPITEMMKNHIKSYKDLPVFVYQFQTKLRNELRAKSGIMRGREFVMKDMYSYTIDAKQHEKFYNSTIDAYLRIFNRVGLGNDTFVTFASGGAFTEFSHEFQTLTDAGEDVIYINREKNIAINEEVLNEKTLHNLNIKLTDLEKVKTAEVGNIFNFGTRKCEQLGLNFINESGEATPVHLGSYGIGITRLMGVIVEHFHDDSGIIWPTRIAPYHVHLISIGNEKEVLTETENVYSKLEEQGIEVLWDDRDLTPGVKFGDSDLIGIPYRIVISKKTLQQNGYELKKRNENKAKIVSAEELINEVKSEI